MIMVLNCGRFSLNKFKEVKMKAYYYPEAHDDDDNDNDDNDET